MQTAPLQKKEQKTTSVTAVKEKTSPVDVENEVETPAGVPLFLQRSSVLSSPPPAEQKSRLEDSELIQTKLITPVIQRSNSEEDEENIIHSDDSSLIQKKSNEIEDQDDEVSTIPVLPKLTAGALDDEYELEADQIADQVAKQVSGPVAEQMPNPNTEPQFKNNVLKIRPISTSHVQSGSVDSLPSTEKVIQVLHSSGSGNSLSSNIQSKIESVLDSDLSDVKVHSDSIANQAAQSIHAKAFTHQNQIYLGKGQSPNDISLMAHEATHVVQQSHQPAKYHAPAIQSKLDDYASYTDGHVTIHIWPKLGQMGATLGGEPWVSIQWDPKNFGTPDFRTEQISFPMSYGLSVKASFAFRVTLNRYAEKKYARSVNGTLHFSHEYKTAGSIVTVNDHLPDSTRITRGGSFISHTPYQGEKTPLIINPEVPPPAHLLPPLPQPRPFYWKFDTLDQLQAFVAVHPHQFWGEFSYEDNMYIAVSMDEEGMHKLADAFRQDPAFPLVRVYSSGKVWKSTDIFYEKYYASHWQAAYGAPGDAKECLVFKHDAKSFGRKPLSHNEAINTWGYLEFFGGPHKFRIKELEGKEFVALYVNGRRGNHRIDNTYFTAREQFFNLVKHKEKQIVAARGIQVGQSWEDMMKTYIPGKLTIWSHYLSPALDRDEAIVDDKLKKIIDSHPQFVEAAGERILKQTEDLAKYYTFTILDGAVKGLKMFYSITGIKNFINTFLHHMNTKQRLEALEFINVTAAMRPVWVFVLGNSELVAQVMMNKTIAGVSMDAIREHAVNQADDLLTFKIHIENGDVVPLHMEGEFGHQIRRHVYDLMGFNLHPMTHPHESDAKARDRRGGQRPLGYGSVYGSEAGYLYAKACAARARSKRRWKIFKIVVLVVASLVLVILAAKLGLLLAGLYFAGKTALVVGFAIELAIITAVQPALTTFIMSEGKATAEDYKNAYDTLGEQALFNLITMGIFRFIGWLTHSWAILKAGSQQALQASTRIRAYELGLRFGISSVTAFNIGVLVHAIKKGEIPKGTSMNDLLFETALSMVLMEVGGAMTKGLSSRIQMYTRKVRLNRYLNKMDTLQLKINDLNLAIASFSARPHRMIGKGKGLAKQQIALLKSKQNLLNKMKKDFRARPDGKSLERELDLELSQISKNLQKLKKVGYLAEAEVRPESLATEEIRFRYKRGTENLLEKFYGKENVVKKKGFLEVTTSEGRKLIFKPSTKLHPELGFSGAREPKVMEAWQVNMAERQLKLLKRADTLAETNPELKTLAKAKPNEMNAKQLKSFERILAKAELHISKAEAAKTHLEMNTKQRFDSIGKWRLRLVEVRGNLLRQAELLGQSKHPYVEQMRQLPTKRKGLKANTLKKHAKFIERARKVVEAGRTDRFRSLKGQKSNVAEPDMAPLQKQLNQRKTDVLRRAKFYGATRRKYIQEIIKTKVGSRKKFESLREAEARLEKAEQHLDKMALETLHKAEAVLGKKTIDAARSKDFSEMSDVQVGDALRQLGVTGKLSADALRGLFFASMAPPKSSGARTHIPINKIKSLARSQGELVFVLETFGQMRDAGIKGTYKTLRDSMGGKGKWKGGVWQMELVRFRFGIGEVKALEVKMTSGSGNREVDIYLHDGRKIEAKDWDVLKLSTIEQQFRVDVDIATLGGLRPEGIKDIYWMFRYSKGVNIGKIRGAMNKGLEQFINAKIQSGDITPVKGKALRKALAEHGTLVEIPTIERTKVQPPRPSGRSYKSIPITIPTDDPDRKKKIKSVQPPALIQRKPMEPESLKQEKQDKDTKQIPCFPSVSEPQGIYERQADDLADMVQRKSGEISTGNMNKEKMSVNQTGSYPLDSGNRQEHSTLMTPPVQHVIQYPGSGTPVEPNVCNQTESILGKDLGHVRVHQNPESYKAAQSIYAKAFTHKNNIWLGKGQNPHDPRLMAHELTHVAQQGSGKSLVQADLLDDAIDLQTKANALTNKGGAQIFVPSRPTSKIKLRKWQKRTDVKKYFKAYQLALKIMTLVPKAGDDVTLHNDIEARAQMIAEDLLRAVFVEEAMDIAEKISTNTPAKIKADPAKLAELRKKDNELKGYIYKPLIGIAHKIDEKYLIKITRFYNTTSSNPEKHPVLEALTKGKCEYAKKIGWIKVKSILNVVVDGYADKATLIDSISKVLLFHKKYRQKFSLWMWQKDKKFLYSILNAKWFVEPGYDGAVRHSNQTELKLKQDFPWVYTWKQKYYIEYLIDLCTKAKVKDATVIIPPDPKLSDKPGKAKKQSFSKVKKWLDKHTENIGKALGILYPADPDKILDVYHKIGDIFFHHVDQGHVKADRFGKLARLGRGAPGMRIKADCDVLASYAARLMKSSGFNVLGYSIIVSCDANRAHHGAGLLKKGNTYYAVSNKKTFPLTANNLADAKTELDAKALDDAYYKPYPKHYTVYHNAGKNGELPKGYLPLKKGIKATCEAQKP